MRIAIVSLMGGAMWGGSEPLWVSVAEKCLSEKNKLLISVYKWPTVPVKIRDLAAKGADISYRKNFNTKKSLIQKVFSVFSKIYPQLKTEYKAIINYKPQFVLISQPDTFDLVIEHIELFKLLKNNNIPYSLICHSHQQFSYIPDNNIFPKGIPVFLGANKIYFVSNRQKKLTERRLAVKLENSEITSNPLNFNIPHSVVKVPSNTLNIAMVGVLGGSKGQDTAMEALSESIWSDRNWVLNLYGEGDGENYLRKLASFYNISERVKFKGYVNDIPKMWRENDLLLIASSWEGLPISLVEAMACSRCAVATDIGGISELIINGETGFLATSPTVEGISIALEQMWNNKNLIPTLGMNAYKMFHEKIEKDPGGKIYSLIMKTVN